MILPTPHPVGIGDHVGGYKAIDEFIHRVAIGNNPHLKIVEIKRDRNISWVPHDIDNARVAWIKTLMTFQDTGQPSQPAIRRIVDHRYKPVHVGESDGFVLEEISEEKTRPRAAGPEVANKKNVIRKYGKGSSRRNSAASAHAATVFK